VFSSSSAKSPSSPSSSSKTTGYGSIQQQQYDYVPFMNEEICEKILLDESEELYNKMVDDLTNKIISNLACDNKPSSLSLLPRKEISDVQKDSTQKLAASYTYRKEEEEHTFIQSKEIDGHDDDDK
jgi:hypothetical protein